MGLITSNPQTELITDQCDFPLVHPGGIQRRQMRHWVLHVVRRGSGLMRRRRAGDREVSERAVYLVPPQSILDVDVAPSASEWVYNWVLFRPQPHLERWLHWSRDELEPTVIDLEEDTLWQEMQMGADEIHRYFRSGFQRRFELCFNVLERMLILLDLINPRSLPQVSDERLRRAMLYMQRHFTDRLSVDSVAKACGLSSSRFAHLFSEALGVTPMRYVEQLRLERARELLQSGDHSVGAIAEQLGFCDAFHFSKRFSSYFGLPPSHLRNRA
jgi:AraC family transcriptional regulator, arabinose operon regulatory protein